MITNHSALTSLLEKGLAGTRPLRINRWYCRLLEYDFNMKFRPWADNQVADALSRLPLPADMDRNEDGEMIAEIGLICQDAAMCLEEITQETLRDPVLSDVIQYISVGWPLNRKKLPSGLSPYYAIREELTIVGNCVMRGSEQIVLPSSLIRKAVNLAHNAHAGICKTKAKIRQFYWWPNLAGSVESIVRECKPCQLADKSAKPVPISIQPVSYPMQPWGKISIDILGPFATAPRLAAFF